MTLAFYKKIALALWGLVAAVAGYTAGVLYGWSGRELIFAVVLGLGVWGLIAIRILKSGMVSSDEGSHPDDKVKLLIESGSEGDLLAELINRENNLEPKEASRWLDGFLERHQK